MRYIYALVDPRDNTIRYVGQTDDTKRRYSEHTNRIEATAKGAWIQELRSLDLRPSVVVLDTCDDQRQSNYLESWWMILGRRQGWQLVNGTSPSIERVKESVKALYTDELIRMYEEHKSINERLNSEIVAAAVQREKIKIIDRVWYGVYAVHAVFILMGVIYLSTGFWGEVPTNLSSFEVMITKGCFVALWAMMFGMIYSHNIARKADDNVEESFLLRLAFGGLSILIIVFGMISFAELANIWGWL